MRSARRCALRGTRTTPAPNWSKSALPIGTDPDSVNTDDDTQPDPDELGDELTDLLPTYEDELEDLDPDTIIDLLPDTDGDGKPDITESDIADRDDDGVDDEHDSDDSTPPSTTTTEALVTTTTTAAAATADADNSDASALTANEDTASAPDENTDSNMPLVAGLGLGGAIGIVGLLLFLFKRRKKDEDQQASPASDHLDHQPSETTSGNSSRRSPVASAKKRGKPFRTGAAMSPKPDSRTLPSGPV